MKKILISMVIITILFSCFCNYTFAAITYERTGGEKLSDIATKIDDNTYIYADATAKSVAKPLSDYKIYDYNTTTEKEVVAEQTYSESNKHQFYYSNSSYTIGSDTIDALYYTIKLGEGEQTASDVATFVIKDGISYEGESYSVKINLKKVYKEGPTEQDLRVRIGTMVNAGTVSTNPDDYTRPFYPTIGVETHNNENKVEADIEYYVVKITDEGEISTAVLPTVTGLFGISDIDLNQGIFIDGLEASDKKLFIKNEYDEMKYKTINNKGTYIYTTDSNDTEDRNAYLLLKDENNVNLTFTFDTKSAYSNIMFVDNVIKLYKKVEAIVEKGTISPDNSDLNLNELKETDTNIKINYQPNNPDTQYLKSITVDGTDLTPEQMETNNSNYTFPTMTENHIIKVVYEDKYKIVHDPKGGSPTPENQYVMPNEKAHTVTEPTKEGYDFGGWIKQGETTAYDYDTPVTSDITLEAKWTPKEYNLTYILNGGTRNVNNVDRTFTVEDNDITYADPTREGYTFDGWYLEEDFSGEKQDGLSPAVTFHDVTVYAKWTPATEPETAAKYVVEHYKETSDGNYELATTEELTGKIDSAVTATPKEFNGYKENTTHSSRIPSGTVAEDGSLVLKLYYDKEKYKVTFDPQGGTPDPADQTVKYNDKATKPSNPKKDGYTFEYWYYINDEDKKVRYNFDDPVTKDVELIAEWEKDVINNKDKSNDSTKTIPTKANTDTTTSSKKLPNTGMATSIALICLAVIVVASGIKYFKLKEIFK